jgi:ankyrin repeat protein
MDDFFVPVIQEYTASLRRVIFQFDELLHNASENECQTQANNSPCWELPDGVDPSAQAFRYIYENIESYLTNNFKDTEPAVVHLPSLDKNYYKEQSKLGDEALSVMLGIFLAAAKKIMGWDVNDCWCTITATGTFKNIEPVQDGDLLLEKIGDLKDWKDNEGRHFQGKISGFKRDINKIERKNGKHLFLYISDDNSLEEENKDGNNDFYVKAFSPKNNTLFDILDYVFDLHLLPDRFVDDEQEGFFRDFEEKTKYLRKKEQIESPFYHNNKFSSLLENDSLFIHGPYGGGKSYLAMQIVRRLVWERKIYAPIWINFNNERLTEAGLEPKTINLKRNNEMFAPPQEIQIELLSVLANYNDARPWDKKLTGGKKHLIIIDGLDLPDQLLKEFLSIIKNFHAFIGKNNNHVIFTSTNEVPQDRGPLLENLKVETMPSFDSNAVWTFFEEISKDKKYYNQIIDKMGNSHTGGRKLSDLAYFQKLLCEYYGNSPHLLEIISDELFLNDKDYKDFLLFLETADKNDLFGKASVCYRNFFNNPDPHNMHNDNVRWILFYLLNYGPDKFITFEKIQNDIDEIIGKDDPDAGNIIRKILFSKSGYDRRHVLDILNGAKLILQEDDAIKIHDKLIYKTLILDDYFSSNELWVTLVSEKRKLNELIYFYFAYKNKDILKQEKGKEKLKQWLQKINFKKGCSIFHGIARWCTYIEVFEILLKICPDFVYSTNEKGETEFVVDDNGMTILHYAAGKNPDPGILELIVQKASECGLKNYFGYESKFGNNVLHYALEFNLNPQIIHFLLEQNDMTNEVINHRNSEGCTALHYATTIRRDYDITKQLIKFGADPNIKDNNHKFTPLHFAVEIGMGAKFVDLLATPENIDAKTGGGFYESTPLLLALNTSSHEDEKKSVMKDTVKELINHKANVEIPDNQGNTPLHYAVVTCGDIEILTLLITKNTINSVNKQGWTPLAYAKHPNFAVKKEVIEFLLQHGAKR